MFTFGKTTVQKIYEFDLNGFRLNQLLPGMDEHLPDQHPDWLPAGTVADGHALLSVHSWLVRHEGMVILVDTGAGNDKSRPQQSVLDHLCNPFLERLAEAGVRPEMVDYVLHTHIHSDHVGWNTHLLKGTWEPTFPNAMTICSRLEWEYGEALANSNEHAIQQKHQQANIGKPVRIPLSGTFDDSMKPLLPERVRLIEIDGSEVLPNIRFLPTPGHSIDHAAIEFTGGGQRAIFGGDIMHHPVELYDTDLVSTFCEFPAAARASRKALLNEACEQEALYFSAHFPLSSAGRITRKGDGFLWTFLE